MYFQGNITNYTKSLGFISQTTFIQTQNSCVRLDECGLFNSNTVGWLSQISIFHIMFRRSVGLIRLNTLTDKENNISLKINLLC